MKFTLLMSRRSYAFFPLLTAILLLVPACGQGDDGEAVADATATTEAPAAADVLHGGAAAPGKAAPPAPVVPPETVVITVDGVPITRGELDRELQAMVFGGMQVDASRMAQVRKQFGPRAEKALIERTLLAGAAAREKLTVTAEELAARWAEIDKRYPQGMTREQFLKRNGLTRAEADEKITSGLKIEKLFEKHGAPAPTTDEQARAHYDANVLKFTTKAQVRARHILIKVAPTADDAEKARVKKQLADIREQILAKKTTFAEMAMQHSGCPSKKDGGDLKFFGRGQMVPEFDTLAFTMAKGAITEPFLTQFGYHIMEVTDKREAGTRKFEEVKEQVKAQLDQQGKQKAQATYMDSLRAAAKIERPTATAK